MIEKNHLLFSYGTLQLESVQLENYGRLLKGEREKLFGYTIEKLKITDLFVIEKSKLEFHPIAIKSYNQSDFIEGTIFEITETELLETDKYEVAQYSRILETFASGKKAWIYIGTSVT